MWKVGCCQLLFNTNNMVTRSVCVCVCVFAEVFIHVSPKGLAFVERLQFAGQPSLDLPAPPPKPEDGHWDWRAARQAWEDGGRQGFIEVRTDFSEASHGLRDAPPPPRRICMWHGRITIGQVLAATLSLHR